MFHVRDPSIIKLFGMNICHTHNILTASDSTSITQIHPLPQHIMNEYEDSTRTAMDVPWKDGSRKQTNLQEDVKGTSNISTSPTPELVSKVVHNRTKEDKIAKIRDTNQHEQVLKKPDKVLPCPRCNSLETKFCYFNNYNVNQPRHFCKNCQRYWTAGGTIRNVPVGAGKRKNNKHLTFASDSNPASSDMHISTSVLSMASSPFKGIGNVHAPLLSESLETLLNLKGKKKIEMDSSAVEDDGSKERPSSSSMRYTESLEKKCSENGMEHVDLVPLHPLQYYPVPPWTYQWNPCWNAMGFRPSSMIASSSPAYIDSSATMMPPSSSYCQKEEDSSSSSLVGSSFGGMILSPSSSSPTLLGKHSRDGSTPEEGVTTMNENLWIPKTVRINDPEEAARSSIWSTLCTKSEKSKAIIKGSVFKSFEPKSNGGSSHNMLEDNQILRENPAALSRSESFQENM